MSQKILIRIAVYLKVISIVGVASDPASVLDFAVRSLCGASPNPDFSHFVVEEDSNQPSESWNCKVWESKLTRSKGIVQEWNVCQSNLQQTDEHET